MQRKFKKMELYVVRINNNDEIKYSAPCNHCLDIIKTLQIKKIIYSIDNGGFEIVKPQYYNNNYITLGFRQII